MSPNNESRIVYQITFLTPHVLQAAGLSAIISALTHHIFKFSIHYSLGILLMTLWGAALIIELISIPLTNKYHYWQIYGIFLNEDLIESGILRFFLFIIYLFIQLFVIIWAWVIFTNVWWYWLGFDKEEKNKNE